MHMVAYIYILYMYIFYLFDLIHDLLFYMIIRENMSLELFLTYLSICIYLLLTQFARQMYYLTV